MSNSDKEDWTTDEIVRGLRQVSTMTEFDLDLRQAVDERDFEFIAGAICDNAEMGPPYPLTSDDKKLLAWVVFMLLNGELKKPPHKSRSKKTRLGNKVIFEWFQELHSQGWKPEAAVAEVHRDSGISDRWLWNFWKEVVLVDEARQELDAIKRCHGEPKDRVEVFRRCVNRLAALPHLQHMERRRPKLKRRRPKLKRSR